jgi:hypothetical protein
VAPLPLRAPGRRGRWRRGSLRWGSVGSLGHWREGRSTLSPSTSDTATVAGRRQRAARPVGGSLTVALSGPAAQPAARRRLPGSRQPKLSQGSARPANPPGCCGAKQRDHPGPTLLAKTPCRQQHLESSTDCAGSGSRRSQQWTRRRCSPLSTATCPTSRAAMKERLRGDPLPSAPRSGLKQAHRGAGSTQPRRIAPRSGASNYPPQRT